MSNHKWKGRNDPIAFGNGSDDISLSLAETVLMEIDTPVSLSIFLMIQYREFRQIVEKGINPADYNCSQSFADDYQAVNLLRKHDSLPTDIDKKQAALTSFWDAEEACRLTNRRLVQQRYFPKNVFSASVFHTAARLIATVLGDLDPSLLIEGMDYGKGVSSSVKGQHTSRYNKSLGKLEVTAPARRVGMVIYNHIQPLPAAVLTADGPCSILLHEFSVVGGNTVSFVPKNAKTFRAIAVEPHVNILVQKGIGSYIRSRLKRVGINLHDQRRNQELSRLASIRNDLATVDLSAASDTISIELVRELLPPEWFHLLDILRSQNGKVEGKWIRYEKFSSMGNGFTFELETLIFWSLTKAIMDLKGVVGVCSVYGDDIICPSSIITELEQVFSFSGFTINLNKSFHNTYFRESCGMDYFNGTLVTSFFIRGRIKDTHQRISIHNQIFKYALRRNCFFGLDSRFKTILKRIKGRSPYIVHPTLGDVGFWSLTIPKTARRPKNWVEGYLVKGLVRVPNKVKMVEYYAALYHSFVTTSEDSYSDGFYPMRESSRLRTLSILVPAWHQTTERDFSGHNR